MSDARSEASFPEIASWFVDSHHGSPPHDSMCARLKNPQQVGISAYYIKSKEADRGSWAEQAKYGAACVLWRRSYYLFYLLDRLG
jgi:hypothetical protein